MKKIFIPIILFLALASCETKVELDVSEGPKNIVIDGGITDKTGHDTIYLTLTQDYNSTEPFTYISGATLVITENESIKDTLLEVAQGVYITQNLTKGTVGSSYQLYLRTPEGVEYQSTVEVMPEGPPIDSLYFRRSDEMSFSAFLEDGYYGMIAFQDPANERNYMDYKYTVNGVFQNNPTDINLYQDQYTNGQYVSDFMLRKPLQINDQLQIEQLAITGARYDYLNSLQQLLTANGGPFDPPIPPLIGNIFKIGSTTEYALGYFQAESSIIVEGVVVVRP